jgi:sugar lactone lactonase YvrE
MDLRSSALRSTLLAAAMSACEEESPCPARAGVVCPVAGTGDLGFNRDGLPATETDLFLVSAARRGPDDRIWIVDFNNQRMRVIDEEQRVQTVIGSGFHALADAGAPALASPMENPIDFGFLSDGRLVFVSYHDPRVIVLGDDGFLQVVAGTGEQGLVGDEGDGGPALEAMFIQLDGIAVAPDDSIYVSDSLANRVRLVKDGMVTTVAGTGAAGYAGDGGPAAAAVLFWPSAIELDGDGNLYIADTFNHAVRKLATDGTITTVAGVGTPGAAGDGGPGTAAQLDQPFGLAAGDDGTIYISDRGNFKVRLLDKDGVIDTLAGSGHQGASGDGGPADRAQFAYLARIALDDDGLLIADQSNSLVRRMTLR